jgi:hypothetical protein
MIEKSTVTIDSQEKEGQMAALDQPWATNYPHRMGKTAIGSYTVPANKTAKLKGIWVFGQYADCPYIMGLATGIVGTVYFQVDGQTKTECRIQANAIDFTAAPITCDFDITRRTWNMHNGVPFSPGQIIRLIVSPASVAGQGAQQALWLVSFAGKDTATGAHVIIKARTITITKTADQVIVTYTVPANGFTLKNIFLQVFLGDYFLGHAQLRLNGLLFAEYPLYDSHFRTTPTRSPKGIFPLYDGIALNHGDKLEARIDPPLSVNQKFHLVVWGTETDAGGAAANIFVLSD